jgi:nicotinamide mononucleotide transporter
MLSSTEALDIAAAILSVSGTITGSARLKISWPLSFSACLLYSILFYQKELLFNTVIHIIYLPLSVLGLYLWREKNPSTLKIKSTPTPIINLIATTCLFVYFYCKVHGLSWHYDFITSFLSITAFVLMGFAQLECWLLWLIADVFYLYLYSSHALFYSLFKSFFYCLITSTSFVLWKRKYLNGIKNEAT